VKIRSSEKNVLKTFDLVVRSSAIRSSDHSPFKDTVKLMGLLAQVREVLMAPVTRIGHFSKLN
jgi:hypothetical protein